MVIGRLLQPWKASTSLIPGRCIALSVKERLAKAVMPWLNMARDCWLRLNVANREFSSIKRSIYRESRNLVLMLEIIDTFVCDYLGWGLISNNWLLVIAFT